jgi:glycosyltransferase involved in cell wall biosynthesis
LAALYGQAEVAVVPSLYEGFSLPAIEAMACGVAVVATTGGALPEVVGTDGETGLLVAPDDPGALAVGIARLLDDPALRARLGAAGRERVISRFTWQVTAAGTTACYRALLDGMPLPGAPAAEPAAISADLKEGNVAC